LAVGVFLPWLLATAGFAQYMHASYRVNFAPFSKDFFRWYYKMFQKTRYNM
jgi:meiotically up-regulated gene 157 (Mug157) protein